MKQSKWNLMEAVILIAAGILGGCVSIESGTLSESEKAHTGTKVHATLSNDGFFEVFGPLTEMTVQANRALASQCTHGQLTDVQDQLSKRDVLLLVQIYTVRAAAVCLPPQGAPLKVSSPVPLPKHELVHAKKTERGLVFTLGAVLFAVNKADLNSRAQKSIEELTSYLKDNPGRNIQVEGYTDSTGNKRYNHLLSVRRAESVKEALVDGGIDSGRIRIRGYGDRYPVATNSTFIGRQENRRVEVVISDEKGHFLKNR